MNYERMKTLVVKNNKRVIKEILKKKINSFIIINEICIIIIHLQI